MIFNAAKKFFSKEESAQIVEAIQKAESKCTGEIRVHLNTQSKKDNFLEAQRVFEKLGMTQTKYRNGILFYLCVKDKQFVLLGDQRIHEKVGEDFWRQIKDEVLLHFKSGDFLKGLISGIEKCGKVLEQYFPVQQENNPNELSNEVSVS